MEESRLRCPRCGSVDLQARLGAETRCWRCGAVTPLAAPTPRALPDISAQPRSASVLSSNSAGQAQPNPDNTFVVPVSVPKEEAEALIKKTWAGSSARPTLIKQSSPRSR